MKTRINMIRTMAMLLTLGLILSGCFANTGTKMMDDSMTSPVQTMEKAPGTENMSGTMKPMKEGAMKETAPVPMDNMKRDDMGNDMKDSMK